MRVEWSLLKLMFFAFVVVNILLMLKCNTALGFSSSSGFCLSRGKDLENALLVKLVLYVFL